MKHIEKKNFKNQIKWIKKTVSTVAAASAVAKISGFKSLLTS